MTASRSPSPNPARPTNPNLKTPESTTIRRSASFNLSKSSITSEVPQKISSSKSGRDLLPCMRASFDQKENDRGPNCAKTTKSRSSSKGSKNFMAPTISASSKAIAASPIKKILVERNEVISVSDSHEFSSISDMGSDAQGMGIEEVGSKSEMGSGFREILGSAESRKVDPKIKNLREVSVPPISPSPVIAPLDADPSLPPYDPKTNYLSPRPRFLHYKPNPRLEHRLDMEGGSLEIGEGKRLEDSFSSESYDDISVNTEEPLQESDEVSSLTKVGVIHVSETESKSKPNSEELDEESSPTKVGDTHVSEPESKSKPNAIESEESSPTKVEVTHVSQPESRFNSWSFRRSRILPLLFVLIVVFLSAPLSDSPIITSSSSMLKDHSSANPNAPSLRVLEDLYLKDYVTLANVHLRGLSNSFKHWSISSISYLSTLASIPKELSSLYPDNSTVSAADQAVDLDFIFTSPRSNQDHHPETEFEQSIKESMTVEENCLGDETEGKIAIEVSEDTKVADNTEYGPENMVMEVLEGTEGGGSGYEAEKFVVEVTRDEIKIEEDEVSEDHQDVEEDVHQDVENEIKQVETEKSHPSHEEPADFSVIGPTSVEDQEGSSGSISSSINSLNQIQPDAFAEGSHEEHQISDSLRSQELFVTGSEDKLSSRTILGLSSAVVIMIATAIVYLYMKHSVVATHERVPSKKQVTVPGSSEICSNAKGSPSPFQNLGSSEVSDISHSASSFGHRRRTKGEKEEEALSDERRARRESTVSSSISYGSFTTYEKLSAKKGCRDEDSATPVRRSSRIRNQITSP